MPMRFSGFAFGMCLAAVAFAAVPVAKKSTTARKMTAKSLKPGAKSSLTKGPAVAKGSASRSTKQKKAAYVSPPRQAQPSTERYGEIQSALVEKGYLKNPPTGVWDQESTNALRQFQQDQKLEPSGKLTSKSLILLGLGARSGSQLAPPIQPPQPQ